MKKKLIILVPALFGMFLSACGGSEANTPLDKKDDPSNNPAKTQFTVTFKSEEDQVLESKKWDEGATPSYNYVKNDTAEWDYTVKGWSNSLGGSVTTIPAVSADVTYWAVVDKVKQSYAVAFYKEDNSLIKNETLEYGAQPSCDYTGPVDTAEWDYTFGGWSTTKGGTALTTIPAVSAAVNYYAVVSSAKKKYNVKFHDEDGTLLTTLSFDYGAAPSYTYNKQDTAEWDYTMNGWATSKGGAALTTLPSVTGEASYYAVVSKVKQKYTITFDSKGGTSVNSITQEYGTQVAKPADPKKDGHSFVAWSYDDGGTQTVTGPLNLLKNEMLYANCVH